MSDDQSTDPRAEALQAVFERVNSWQDTAADGTVEKELREGLTEAQIALDDADVQKLIDEIENKGGHENVLEVVPLDRIRALS